MRCSRLLPSLSVVGVLFCQSVQAQNTAPSVSNVQASQRAGSGWVDIYYDVNDLEGDPITARVICSTSGGATFDLFVKTATGDGLAGPVSPGVGKHIEWNAAQDYPGRYWANVIAKVIVTDGAATGGEMVSVPAGNFTMGAPSPGGVVNYDPEHVVYLDGYLMDKYEVTNAEFQVFIEAGGYAIQGLWSEEGWTWLSGSGRSLPAFWGDDSYRSGPGWPGFPVIGVTWYEAEAYAHFVGKRLPTEAEWEKAGRGTDARRFPWGNLIWSASKVNFFESADPYEDPVNARLTPVGFYDGRLHPSPPFQTEDVPGPYGIYDLSGNVCEWVNDWYDPDYYQVSPSSNPLGPPTGFSKVWRGGSWAHSPGSFSTPTNSALSCVNRSGPSPQTYTAYVGFRCVRNAP